MTLLKENYSQDEVSKMAFLRGFTGVRDSYTILGLDLPWSYGEVTPWLIYS